MKYLYEKHPSPGKRQHQCQHQFAILQIKFRKSYSTILHIKFHHAIPCKISNPTALRHIWFSCNTESLFLKNKIQIPCKAPNRHAIGHILTATVLSSGHNSQLKCQKLAIFSCLLPNSCPLKMYWLATWSAPSLLCLWQRVPKSNFDTNLSGVRGSWNADGAKQVCGGAPHKGEA